MAALPIVAGATSQSVDIFIQDSTSTTGGGKTGLVFNTSGLIAYYTFTGANTTATAISLATLSLVTSAWSSGGFIEIDSSHQPGWYRLDLPNASITSGKGREVNLHLQGATGMAPCPVKVNLTGWDDQNATNGGMSALPATACTTNASLLTSGTGTDQISVSAGKLLLQATQTGVTIPAVTTVGTLTTYTGNTPQTGDAYARIGSTGSGLTSLAPSSTALSTGTWTGTRAGYLDNLSGGAVALHSDATSLASQIGTPMQAGSTVVLAGAGLDGVEIESGLNARQALAIVASACAGTSIGVSTGSPVYAGAGVVTTRITATAVNGDRSVVTLSPPA